MTGVMIITRSLDAFFGGYFDVECKYRDNFFVFRSVVSNDNNRNYIAHNVSNKMFSHSDKKQLASSTHWDKS